MDKDKGFKNMNVRFFIYDSENAELDIIEVDETDFKCAEGHIEYKRNTVFENGVSQICLTKNPYF